MTCSAEAWTGGEKDFSKYVTSAIRDWREQGVKGGSERNERRKQAEGRMEGRVSLLAQAMNKTRPGAL